MTVIQKSEKKKKVLIEQFDNCWQTKMVQRSVRNSHNTKKKKKKKEKKGKKSNE